MRRVEFEEEESSGLIRVRFFVRTVSTDIALMVVVRVVVWARTAISSDISTGAWVILV